MTNAYKDENGVSTLIAASTADGKTPVRLYANPTTHRLLVDVATGAGDVSGPASSIDGNVVKFDGTTGKLIKDSGVSLSGNNTGDQTSIVGITGTTAQFNTANTDGDFATIAGSEALSNKTLTAPLITGNTSQTGGVPTIGGDGINTGAIVLKPANDAYNWISWVNIEAGASEGIRLQRGAYPTNVQTLLTVTSAGNMTLTGNQNVGTSMSIGGTSAFSTATAGMQLLGSSTTYYNAGVQAGTSATLATGISYSKFLVGAGSTTTFSSGTHPLLATSSIKPQTVVSGGATVTNTATLYIEEAMTGGTNNYALWVDAGAVKFDAPGNATGNALTTDATQTLTNKRITKRVQDVDAPGATTQTITSDSTDIYTLRGLNGNTTFAAPSGTPTQGQTLMIRIKDDATPRTLTWNAIFRVVGVTLPTTTVASKTHYVGCVYNSTDTKWDVLAVGVEA